ncbi:MAG: efflux RND transporter permease subunit, partial [Pseudomonadota bacterium]
MAVELEEELEDNKKISSIRKSGFRERQFNIFVDTDKLARLHVGLDEVTRAVGSQNVTIPGGTLESGEKQMLVKIDGKLKSAQELDEIVVRANFAGGVIKLKDVADVQDGEEDPRTLSRYEGQGATFLIISKKSGADIIDLANQVREKIDFFNNKYKGQLEFRIYNDEGIRVGNRLDVLQSNGAAGLVLVIFFLMLFLPGRAGIMASLSLPLAVLATFGYIQSSGMSLNTITILAMVISIGMLVDNAVVIAENFVRLVDEGMEQRKAAIESVRTLWLPITATAMTTIAAFLPMLVTKGIIGQFIRGIPLVVTASLIISLLECFILLPMRLVSRKKKQAAGVVENKKDWFARWITPGFSSFIDKLIRFRYLSAIGFGGLIIFSIFMMTVGNKFILFPADQTEIYLGRLEMPRGTTIETTSQEMAVISQKIRESFGDEAILHVTSTVGIAEQDPNDPKGQRGENVGLLKIFVAENTKNNVKTNDFLKQLRDIKSPNADNLSFEAMINGPPVGAPVTAIFRSNNSEQLDKVVNIVKSKLSEVDGIFDTRIDDIYGEEELVIDINSTKANRLGLSTLQIGT